MDGGGRLRTNLMLEAHDLELCLHGVIGIKSFQRHTAAVGALANSVSFSAFITGSTVVALESQAQFCALFFNSLQFTLQLYDGLEGEADVAT